MKKLYVLSFLFVLYLSVSAQKTQMLTDGQSALIYSLPKTELCISVEVEKTVQKPGAFYRYAGRYLAASNVITEEKTIYTLRDIRVKTTSLPDPTRTYSLLPAKNSSLSKLSVNDKGILCGVNVGKKTIDNNESDLVVKTVKSKVESILPLGEEYMMAGSEAKLAEGAAKQIYRIRESRLGLLTSDVEHMPADGLSFNTMLLGLKQMEDELTELFVGKTTTEVQIHKVYFTPTKPVKSEVSFRLSAFKGLVAADDLSGTPYYITIAPAVAVNVAGALKAAKENTTINTILPASTQVSIGDGVNTYFKAEFSIPQFGVVVSVPEDVFKTQNVKVYVDPQTGRLLSVE